MADHIVSQWVKSVSDPETVIISLLGRKKAWHGASEYFYFTFHGLLDTPEERTGKLSFQEWLDQHHTGLGILVREHPTMDDLVDPIIPQQKIDAITQDVEYFVAEHRTVVVVDSFGVSRTGLVVEYLRATPVPLGAHGP